MQMKYIKQMKSKPDTGDNDSFQYVKPWQGLHIKASLQHPPRKSWARLHSSKDGGGDGASSPFSLFKALPLALPCSIGMSNPNSVHIN